MVTPAQRREAVAHLIAARQMSERRACRVAGVERALVRYRSRRPDDAELRTRLRALAHERRRFGYRRLHILLRREGWCVNRKRVQRLYREERLMVRKRGGRKRALGLRAPLPVPDRPNACWSLDFVHDQMTDGRRFRVLVIVDDCTRECLGLVPDTSISGARVARELDRIIAWRGRPEAVLSDNGTELTSNAILAWADEHGIAWRYIQPGKAGAERVRRELQCPTARRAAERDAVPFARRGSSANRGLASRLQPPSPALEARLADAHRLRSALAAERRA
jgi:putative transposase